MEFQKKNQQNPYLSFHLCQLILTKKYFSYLDLFLPMKFESQSIGTVNQNLKFHSETVREKTRPVFVAYRFCRCQKYKKAQYEIKSYRGPALARVQPVNAPVDFWLFICTTISQLTIYAYTNKFFFNFSCMFLNPNNFFQFEF